MEQASPDPTQPPDPCEFVEATVSWDFEYSLTDYDFDQMILVRRHSPAWMVELYNERRDASLVAHGSEIPEYVPLAGRLALRMQQRTIAGLTRQQIACCYAAAEALKETE